MSQQSLYPSDYKNNNAVLKLDNDNIDALVMQWLSAKTHAVVKNLVWFMQHACVIASGGFMGLSINYLGKTIETIRTRDGITECSLKYYPSAHSECYAREQLIYYNKYDVNCAFTKMSFTMRKSCIMMAAAGALIAASYGLKRLYTRIIHPQKAKQ
ncbi:hypothetical protein D5b_00125 [Faustovirus]|nr:hypothetical protein D5b_00125 [Faustovirus]AMN84786.1 hypothetical protein D6_00386 [Faustovirus]AMP44082.1 hypothetical protein PRJ_Dakar_00123 [Faustovirus]